MRVQLYQTAPVADILPIGATPPAGPADFAAQVRLLGYVLQGEARAGEPLYLSLYWQARRTLTVNLKAFVILRDESAVVAQWDTQPVGPLAPSTGWAPGAVQYDPWRLDIPVGIPPAGTALPPASTTRPPANAWSCLPRTGRWGATRRRSRRST